MTAHFPRIATVALLVVTLAAAGRPGQPAQRGQAAQPMPRANPAAPGRLASAPGFAPENRLPSKNAGAQYANTGQAVDFQQDWKLVTSARAFSFPSDHSAHPDYRIEWWYYTGNLTASDGREYGFQLTFFRLGVVARPDNPSRWTVRDLYMAHFAVTDVSRGEFHYFERASRAGIGWAGAESGALHVWIDDWDLQAKGGHQMLRANAGGFGVSLDLNAERNPVVHGVDGISKKGSEVGSATCYYSISRLSVSGRLLVPGAASDVSGTAWMDHEFGSRVLDPDQAGWDWFGVQLNDGRDVMLYVIRKTDGSIDPHSSGTLIDATGSKHLAAQDFSLYPLQRWKSDKSGGIYPVLWRARIPHEGLDLQMKAAIPDQELQTTETTGVTYWEGATRLSDQQGRPAGVGYMELTGYAGGPPFASLQ